MNPFLAHDRRIWAAGLCTSVHVLFFLLAPWIHIHATEDHLDRASYSHAHFSETAAHHTPVQGSHTLDKAWQEWAIDLTHSLPILHAAAPDAGEYLRSLEVHAGPIAPLLVLLCDLPLDVAPPPADHSHLFDVSQHKPLSPRERVLLCGTSLSPPFA